MIEEGLLAPPAPPAPPPDGREGMDRCEAPCDILWASACCTVSVSEKKRLTKRLIVLYPVLMLSIVEVVISLWLTSSGPDSYLEVVKIQTSPKEYPD